MQSYFIKILPVPRYTESSKLVEINDFADNKINMQNSTMRNSNVYIFAFIQQVPLVHSLRLQCKCILTEILWLNQTD